MTTLMAKVVRQGKDEEAVELRWPSCPFHIRRLVGWFVERGFLVNEPAVPTPQNEVEETKNLWKKTIDKKNMSCYSRVHTFKNVGKRLLTYHRGVKPTHVRGGPSVALVVGILANVKESYNGGRTRGPLDVRQAFGPSRGRCQPQKCKGCCDQQVLRV